MITMVCLTLCHSVTCLGMCMSSGLYVKSAWHFVCKAGFAHGSSQVLYERGIVTGIQHRFLFY